MTLSDIINPWGALREARTISDMNCEFANTVAGVNETLERDLGSIRAQLQSERDGSKYLESLLSDARAQIAKFDGDKDGRVGGRAKKAA